MIKHYDEDAFYRWDDPKRIWTHINRHNLNIRYADTVLIVDPEKKLKELMGKVVMENKKKGLTVKYKKTNSK